MKRHCKRVDLADINTVTAAVFNCLKKTKKRTRQDTTEMFAEALGISKTEARQHLVAKDIMYDEGVARIARMLSEEIRTDTISFPLHKTSIRIDKSSNKVRKISVLHIKQLLYDQIVVEAIAPAMRIIGDYQISGVPGKGVHYGVRHIKRWLTNPRMHYFFKLDVRKYYEHIDHDILMEMLSKRVNNPVILKLTRMLIDSCEPGLHIGSYLSQILANFYLSELYHTVLEDMHTPSGDQLVYHTIFYMDDLMFLGTNRKNMEEAKSRVYNYLTGILSLPLKITAGVTRLGRFRKGVALDMLGFKFRTYCTTIRRSIFTRAKRCMVKCADVLKAGCDLFLPISQTLLSYKGYFDISNIKRFASKHNLSYIFLRACLSVSNHAAVA